MHSSSCYCPCLTTQIQLPSSLSLLLPLSLRRSSVAYCALVASQTMWAALHPSTTYPSGAHVSDYPPHISTPPSLCTAVRAPERLSVCVCVFAGKRTFVWRCGPIRLHFRGIHRFSRHQHDVQRTRAHAPHAPLFPSSLFVTRQSCQIASSWLQPAWQSSSLSPTCSS